MIDETKFSNLNLVLPLSSLDQKKKKNLGSYSNIFVDDVGGGGGEKIKITFVPSFVIKSRMFTTVNLDRFAIRV